MTYDEIKGIINNSLKFNITEEKAINFGIQIKIDNGALINCFKSGRYSVQGKNTEEIEELLNGCTLEKNRNIFVVYGHDDIAKTQLEALLRRWDLNPIILDQQASSSNTIIEKLEEYRSTVGYAIVLATPDDEGKAKDKTEYKSRVRQNVVLELGMFLSLLGRERVAILLKEEENFEKPSDIDGLIYIPFKDRVDEVSIGLIRELARQGYTIDPSRI
ncbi:MAG: TIR domain-containing protein [Oscillospiraceae bacterium]